MSGASESTRGIRTLPDEANELTSGELAWVQSEAVKGLWIHNETPGGAINGSNVTFTLANAPASNGAIWLYLNGVLMNYGAGNDFTISGSTITMNRIPESGDVLLVTYRY